MNENKTNTSQDPKTETEQKPGLAHRVGDAIEKLGDKVEHAGFKKVGDAIEKLGDKIEHSQDKEKSKPGTTY